jgi:deoxycytidine triphosphate deaminase
MILSHDEILALCRDAAAPLITVDGSSSPFLTQVTSASPKDSPIQPASLDLTIGDIYVPPPIKRLTSTAAITSQGKIVLEPGHTVVVNTGETLNLSANIAAFGFPPTTLSSRGILMTNPGHVDPGYKGKLHFTLINMGRTQFELETGMKVVTLLLTSVEHPSSADWSSLSRTVPDKPETETLNNLSPDFLDFQNRATQAAQVVLQRSNWLMMYLPIVLAAGAFIATFLSSGVNERTTDHEKRISALESNRITTRVDSLSEAVNRLERAVKVTNTVQGLLTPADTSASTADTTKK